MAYETEALDVAEKNWNMISSTGNSQTSEHVFTRGCKPLNEMRKASTEAYLRTVLVVVNPLTDSGKAEHTGTYDVVASGWDAKYLGYIQTLKKRTPYTLPPITVADDVFSTTTEQVFRNQETPEASTTWIGGLVAGVSKAVSAAADAMKKWTVEVRTETAKYSLIHYSFTDREGGLAEDHYIARNEAPAVGGGPSFTGLPALAKDYSLDFAGAPSRNPNGTWNWYVIRRATLWGAELGAGVTYVEGTVHNFKQIVTGGATTTVDLYRYTVNNTITVKLFNTVKEAIAYSQTGVFGAALFGRQCYHVIGPRQVLGYRCDSYAVPSALTHVPLTYTIA